MAQNLGELTRAITHDPDQTWPTKIVIMAVWGEGRNAKRRQVEIDADQFFGHGRFGAPMDGIQIIGMVDRIRRQGPKI